LKPLTLSTEKYHAQLKEAQQVVTEKTSSLEAEAYKTKRLQEEIAQLRRKTERMKKIEQAGTLDEVCIIFFFLSFESVCIRRTTLHFEKRKWTR
jgi:hypothetical protein